MKTKFTVKLFLCLVALLTVCSTFVLATDTNETNANEILATYETNDSFVFSNMYVFENESEIYQVVDGNVFAFGGTISITGEIYGDLFVMANSLTVSEDAIIHGNIFVCANEVSFSGITSDIYGMATNFTLEASGIVARDVYITASSVNLNGQIGRDAFLSTESLAFASDAEEVIVQGNLSYTAESEFSIPENVVTGEVTYTPVQVEPADIAWTIISSLLTTAIFALAVIALILWIVPKFKNRASTIIAKKSWLSFGLGLLVFFGIILVAFLLLLFTYGYGASIAVALIGFLVLIYAIANTVFGMAVGNLIANKFNWNKTWIFILLSVLVVVLIDLISYIPYIGGPISFITSVLGIGIIGINAYKRKDLVQDKSTN